MNSLRTFPKRELFLPHVLLFSEELEFGRRTKKLRPYTGYEYIVVAHTGQPKGFEHGFLLDPWKRQPMYRRIILQVAVDGLRWRLRHANAAKKMEEEKDSFSSFHRQALNGLGLVRPGRS